MARFVLMNKNVPVLAFEYDLGAHIATRITRVENPEFAPIGMFDRRGEVSKHELNYWWRHRAIPASRAQIDRLLENLKLDSTLELAEKSFGLSLSDRYWINDEDDPKTWTTISPTTWVFSRLDRIRAGRRPLRPITAASICRPRTARSAVTC